MYIMKVKQANGQIIDIPFGPVANGITPQIDKESKHWIIGKEDTGIVAEGQDGVTPYIGEDGYWYVNGVKTEIIAKGQDGVTPHIGEDGCWHIGEINTGVVAKGEKGNQGENGITPYIGEDGYWYIGEINTGVEARGEKGNQGENGITPQVKIEENQWYVSMDGGANWNKTGDAAIPQKGIDYWTQDDVAEIEAEIDKDIAEKIGQIGQPIFVNSQEECSNTENLYILPDGYIYAYGQTDNYANIVRGYKLDTTGNLTEADNDNYCVTNFIPISFEAGAVYICIEGIINAQFDNSGNMTSNSRSDVFQTYKSSSNVVWAYTENFKFITVLSCDISKNQDNGHIKIEAYNLDNYAQQIKYIRIGFLPYNNELNLDADAKLWLDYASSVYETTPIELLSKSGWKNTGFTFGNRVQLYPKFANDIYELDLEGDSTQAYVLSDGYIYAQMSYKGLHYINQIENAKKQDNDELYIGIGDTKGYKQNTKFSGTQDNTEPAANSNFFVTGWIPVKMDNKDNLSFYLKNCTSDNDDPELLKNYKVAFYDNNKEFKALLSLQSLKSIGSAIITNGNEYTQMVLTGDFIIDQCGGSLPKYFRLSLKSTMENNTALPPVLSFSNPISEESYYGKSWKKTGYSFVATNLVQDLQNTIDDLQGTISALEERISALEGTNTTQSTE